MNFIDQNGVHLRTDRVQLFYIDEVATVQLLGDPSYRTMIQGRQK